MPGKRPLHRTEVLAFACSLSMITYLDRVCFGAAVPLIVSDLGLKDVSDLKWAFTAFTIAYAVFEIPSGWLGDAFGPRRTLIRIVIGWSIFTALTGLVGVKIGAVTFGGLGLLCLVRFLFGAGEAGAYPNLARVVANWFPAEQRGRAKGWIWMSGRFMGGFTPLIWTLLVAGTAYTAPLVTWRGAFLLFGLIGVVWCILFSRRFSDHPPISESSIAVPPTPASYGFPWRSMLMERNLWFLGLMYALASFSWYFNINYFHSFLETQFDVKPTSIPGAIMKGGPLLLGGVGCLVGGYWTDSLVRAFGERRWARRIPAMFGHGMCGVCYLIALTADSAWTVALAISLAAFSSDLMMGAAWATCQDIGRRYTAVVAGWMNMLGNLGGALSGWAIGTILENAQAAEAARQQITVDDLSAETMKIAMSHGYQVSLWTFAAVSFVAVLAWLQVNADRPIVDK